MSEMPARIWAENDSDGYWQGLINNPGNCTEFVRADITERMAEALEQTKSALEVFVDPAIDIASAVDVYDNARKAEAKANAVLSAWKDGR